MPAKGKAFNDLSDVSMDDDTFGDGNGAKEEMVIAQTQRKECESKVRKHEFREAGAQWRCTENTEINLMEWIHAVPCPTYPQKNRKINNLVWFIVGFITMRKNTHTQYSCWCGERIHVISSLIHHTISISISIRQMANLFERILSPH